MVSETNRIVREKRSNDVVPFGHPILQGPSLTASHIRVFAGGGTGDSGFLQKAGSPALLLLFSSLLCVLCDLCGESFPVSNPIMSKILLGDFLKEPRQFNFDLAEPAVHKTPRRGNHKIVFRPGCSHI